MVDSDVRIAHFKATCIEKFGAQDAFGEVETDEQVLEKQRNAYQLALEKCNGVHVLNSGIGVDYVRALLTSKHTIEVWRLLKRLIAISTQHHSRGHRMTIELQRGLYECSTPIVTIGSLDLPFEVVGYEDDEYVLRCWFPHENETPEERVETYRVDPSRVNLGSDGMSVVCHGLKNAAYLNGKIGDVRSFDKTTGRYGVYFEDKSIKPRSVKPQNMRILLFDLPDLE